MSLNHKDQNDFSKGGMITFVLSMIVTFAMMIYVVVFGGIDLKEVAPPSAQVPVTQAAAETKTIDLATVKEPWVTTDDMVAAGKQLYTQNCAMCHGAEGKGDGIAGGSLNPKPRNLVTGGWKNGGHRLGLMKTMNEGIPGSSMQSYQAALTVNQRWALVHFIRAITNDKGEGKDKDEEVVKAAASLK